MADKEIPEPERIRITLSGGMEVDRRHVGVEIARHLKSRGFEDVGVIQLNGVRQPYEEPATAPAQSLWDIVVRERPHLLQTPVTVHALQPGEQPRQPTVYDSAGTVRFQANKIIDDLFHSGALDLNQVAVRYHRDEDVYSRRQLNQQLGYSVAGYNDLSVSEANIYIHEAAERLRQKLGRDATGEEEEANWDAEVGTVAWFE